MRAAMKTTIKKSPIVTFGFTLACSSMLLAHEGHDHSGLSKETTMQQVKEGKLCILNNTGNSLGAVLEKDGKIYRCVKAYGNNLEPKAELVWVEVTPKDKGLSTLP